MKSTFATGAIENFMESQAYNNENETKLYFAKLQTIMLIRKFIMVIALSGVQFGL
jgi:hypothetical protein